MGEKIADYAKGTAVVIAGPRPACDICVHVERKSREDAERALFDGRTASGPWANMCQAHFDIHGVGLGIGSGQRLIIEGEDES